MDCVKIGDLVSDRFRIEKVVGAGSFAWVFAAYDLHSGQTVALKMLRPERFADDDALRRFETRELRLLERIEDAGHSPYVVRLLEQRLLRHEGLPFLVLEYVAGPSLQEWLAEKGRLAIKEVARLGAGLARGLSVIHVAGGVHRDLKPSNVRMRNGKTPVLVDLGIARALWETQKLTQHAAPLTPRYAAPEQREGLHATTAADVYALGVCLSEMLVGQTNVPLRLAKLVAACMAKDPRDRPIVQQIVQTLDAFAFARLFRPSLWPLAFLSSCSVFPGQALVYGPHLESMECVPFAGVVRVNNHHEATSTDTTLEWSLLDVDGKVRNHVEVTLPDFDHAPMAIVDDGAAGRYEILGWFGETCRHFSVRACEDRASVRELEPCQLPRPMPFAKSNKMRGDVNGDDMDDVITFGQAPVVPGSSVAIIGNVLQRQKDGSARLIENAFDLSPINAYHMDVAPRTGDIDRDGCADIVVATYPNGGACASSIHVLFGDCEGKFVISDDDVHVPLPVNQPDIGDVDEDGFLDLVTGPDDDGDPGQTFLLRGTGHGFGEAEELIDVFPNIESGRDQPGHGFALLEDTNGDGHLDLVLKVLKTPPAAGNQEMVEWIHLGHGDGTFEQIAAVADDDFKASGGITFLPMRGR